MCEDSCWHKAMSCVSNNPRGINSRGAVRRAVALHVCWIPRHNTAGQACRGVVYCFYASANMRMQHRRMALAQYYYRVSHAKMTPDAQRILLYQHVENCASASSNACSAKRLVCAETYYFRTVSGSEMRCNIICSNKKTDNTKSTISRSQGSYRTVALLLPERGVFIQRARRSLRSGPRNSIAGSIYK